ncbi:hypothetical protein CANARDRAFT_60591 [[Candida] arabinofermentans NRRL YB-2248]|uniref:Uncharacterized protein n=1 Tax=[Candida] arabinofermentans NRRL YB-2248 TaxID=983967 RepID=A0A1E4SYM6_9ASCO|nr:hypothetical protein CANARDRAFT_60591 [[Candida] arabinofermentans NRRL YB-2248]
MIKLVPCQWCQNHYTRYSGCAKMALYLLYRRRRRSNKVMFHFFLILIWIWIWLIYDGFC